VIPLYDLGKNLLYSVASKYAEDIRNSAKIGTLITKLSK